MTCLALLLFNFCAFFHLPAPPPHSPGPGRLALIAWTQKLKQHFILHYYAVCSAVRSYIRYFVLVPSYYIHSLHYKFNGKPHHAAAYAVHKRVLPKRTFSFLKIVAFQLLFPFRAPRPGPARSTQTERNLIDEQKPATVIASSFSCIHVSVWIQKKNA